MSEISSSDWVCAYCSPRRESFAAENLIKEGFEVYLPTYLREVRHARRKSIEVRPLFPRYLFARSGLVTKPVQIIRRAPGVHSLVGGKDPTIVPGAVISYLQASEGDDHHIRFGSDRFRAGDRVQILGGPFSGLEGVFMEASDARRVIILVSFLGGLQRVKLSAHDIHKF